MGMGLTTEYGCDACGLRFKLGSFNEVYSTSDDQLKAFGVIYLVCGACGTQHWIRADARDCLHACVEPALPQACKEHVFVSEYGVKVIRKTEYPPDHLVGELVKRPKQTRIGWQAFREWLNSGMRLLADIFILKCAFCGSEEGMTETMSRSLQTCPHCKAGKMQKIGSAMY
jgi:hypothetical protein